MKSKDIIFVVVQFILFGLIIFLSGHNIGLPIVVKYIGMVISILGLLVCIIALLQLNKNLSPFPTPKENGHLITNGLYSIVRHPIYLGLVLLFVGYSIYFDDFLRLGFSILLIILFEYKSSYEESLLIEKFEAYQEYRKGTGKIYPYFRI
ncbi:MAG: isoprenylcysteine carboxylmethyltransferase family protein [Saprospiraceae bacterium]